MPKRIRLLLCLLLGIAACECEDDARPARSGQLASHELTPEVASPFPPPTGSPISGDTLASALPESLGDAKPDGDTRVRTTPLGNGGHLTSASRDYRLGEQRVELEISDTLHSPGVRSLIEREEPAGSSTSARTWSTTAIVGHPAIAQYLELKRKGTVNVLLAHRVLINLTVHDADGSEQAVKLAEQLPFEAIGKLVPEKKDAQAAKPSTGEPSDESKPTAQ